MTFDSNKKDCLAKMKSFDKSRKKSIDKLILPVLDYINGLPDYYTTSSCSGRIYLLTEPETKKKHEVQWLYVSHSEIPVNKITKILSSKIPKETVWLRQEGMILHVACRTLESANKILNIARLTGFRRSGIIADNKKIIVEICSTEKMDVPLSKNGKVLVDKNYICFIVSKANQKHDAGLLKLNNFFEKIKKELQ